MMRGTHARVSRPGLPSTAGVSAPLDRRFRRPDRTPGRRRRVGPATRVLVRLLALVVLVGVPGLWAGRAVLGSDLLRVDRVVVRGASRLTPADVEGLVDGIRGTQIFAVDLERCRRQLLASPWVADVTVWRVLPSTIELRVTERAPVAVARLGRALHLVDRSGVVLDRIGPAYRDLDLPVVDGLLRVQDGRPTADPERLRLASRVLAALEGTVALRGRLSQLDVSSPHNARVLLDDDPVWLHLGEDDFADRVGDYLQYSASLRDRFPGLDYVDLRFDGWIPLADRPGGSDPDE